MRMHALVVQVKGFVPVCVCGVCVACSGFVLRQTCACCASAAAASSLDGVACALAPSQSRVPNPPQTPHTRSHRRRAISHSKRCICAVTSARLPARSMMFTDVAVRLNHDTRARMPADLLAPAAPSWCAGMIHATGTTGEALRTRELRALRPIVVI